MECCLKKLPLISFPWGSPSICSLAIVPCLVYSRFRKALIALFASSMWSAGIRQGMCSVCWDKLYVRRLIRLARHLFVPCIMQQKWICNKFQWTALEAISEGRAAFHLGPGKTSNLLLPPSKACWSDHWGIIRISLCFSGASEVHSLPSRVTRVKHLSVLIPFIQRSPFSKEMYHRENYKAWQKQAWTSLCFKSCERINVCLSP